MYVIYTSTIIPYIHTYVYITILLNKTEMKYYHFITLLLLLVTIISSAISTKNVKLVDMEICKLKDDESGCKHIVLEVYPSWSPNGANRFLELVRAKHYTNTKFFRVINNFMAQVGIGADPAEQAIWRNKPIKDDVVKQSNKRGYVTFATAGPNTRSMQIFFNFKDNSFLDKQGFSPFAKVASSGMNEVIDKLHVTGEGQPSGKGPAQNLVQSQGNKYLDEKYPELSYIKSAKILNDFGSKNEDVAQKEKSLRGDVDEKPKEKTKLDLGSDVHVLEDNIGADNIDDDGLDNTLRYGAWFASGMICFLCACMIPRGGGGSASNNRRNE